MQTSASCVRLELTADCRSPSLAAHWSSAQLSKQWHGYAGSPRRRILNRSGHDAPFDWPSHVCVHRVGKCLSGSLAGAAAIFFAFLHRIQRTLEAPINIYLINRPRAGSRRGRIVRIQNGKAFLLYYYREVIFSHSEEKLIRRPVLPFVWNRQCPITLAPWLDEILTK